MHEGTCLEPATGSKWNGGAGATVGGSTSGSFSSFRGNNNSDENSNPNGGGAFGSRSAGTGFHGSEKK